MKTGCSIFLVLFLLMSGVATGQSWQMLLMKRGSIVTRYNPGDPILYVLKGDKQVRKASILAVHEFDFVTSGRDTIPFSSVAAIKFRSTARKKYAVSTMLGGAALLGVYLLNSSAFDKNESSMRGLRFIGLYGMGVGVLILLTSNQTVRLNGIKRLKGISYTSPLYK